MVKLITEASKRMAKERAGDNRYKLLKQVEERKSKFIAMLNEAVWSGKITLPDDLSDELFILNMDIQNAAELEKGANTLWDDELYAQLANMVDEIRATNNPETGRKYTIEQACKVAGNRTPFKDFKHPEGSKRKGLNPIPKTYRDAVKVRDLINTLETTNT